MPGSIDYIYFLSTTTKHQPEMPDYVNNNSISGPSQLLRSTRYQVPGISRRKKDGERKKRKEKNRKMKQSKHALREQAVS